MVDTSTATIIIQIAGFIGSVVTVAVGGTRALSNMELRLSNKIAQAREETDGKMEKQYRDFGESLIAIRSKISEVEIWGRDNYARREGYQKIEAVLERIQMKMDRERD